jgi:hypothetical protein
VLKSANRVLPPLSRKGALSTASCSLRICPVPSAASYVWCFIPPSQPLLVTWLGARAHRAANVKWSVARGWCRAPSHSGIVTGPWVACDLAAPDHNDDNPTVSRTGSTGWCRLDRESHRDGQRGMTCTGLLHRLYVGMGRSPNRSGSPAPPLGASASESPPPGSTLTGMCGGRAGDDKLRCCSVGMAWTT